MIAEFIIYALATWRIAALLARDPGPFEMFSKLRNELGVRYDEESRPYGTNVIAKGIICVWCSSIWIAIVFAVFGRGLPDLTVYLIKVKMLSYQGSMAALTLTLILAKTVFYVALPLAMSAGAVLVNGVIEWHEQAHQRS